MLPNFPRFDFDGALEMSKEIDELHREFATQIPKLRDARNAMLVEWYGPYGDYLYEHCLENDLENRTHIRVLDDWAQGWRQLWRTMIDKTNAVSYAQAAYHQREWDYWDGNEWGPKWQPPIEPRVVDGRFLEAPRWSVYNGEIVYGRRAPHPPQWPDVARGPVGLGASEPAFVYYELERDRWLSYYSYQVPVPPPENHGRGPRRREIVPLRPWNLPENQPSDFHSIDLALVQEYLITSKEILVSLRASLDELERKWREFERRSECENQGSDRLKYLDMVVSEMWRTRQFVSKVRRRLVDGDELGNFGISMPEWRSTPGTRRPPSWEHRGARFKDLAEEIGLVDRRGNPTTFDRNDERRDAALEKQRKKDREYARYLHDHDQMVAEDIAQTIANNPDKYAQPTGSSPTTGGATGTPGTTEGQLTSRRYIAGPWYATDEPILDVPGADYPTYDADRDGPLFVEWRNGERVDPNAPSPEPTVVTTPAPIAPVTPLTQPAAVAGPQLPPADAADAWFPARRSGGTSAVFK